jgi:predicted lactoylglutathione lyase
MIGYVTLGTNDIKKAIELGAQDEGAAGPRGTGFYAGYFRDPDGNKLNVFCMT